MLHGSKMYSAQKIYLTSVAGKPTLAVAGTGRPLRQFIFSNDLAKLMVWALREYEDITPLILSVSEQEEVSIEQVARSVVKAFDFNCEIMVSACC